MKLVWPWNQMDPNDDAEKLSCYYNIIISWHKMGTGTFENEPKIFDFLRLFVLSFDPNLQGTWDWGRSEGGASGRENSQTLWLQVLVLVIGYWYWLLQVLVSIWRLSMTLTGTNQNQTKTNLSCLMEGNTVRLCRWRYLYKCHLKWMWHCGIRYTIVYSLVNQRCLP